MSKSPLLVVLTTIVFSAFFSGAFAGPKKDWKKAMAEDSIATYNEFISKYPESKYVSKIQEAKAARSNKALVSTFSGIANESSESSIISELEFYIRNGATIKTADDRSGQTLLHRAALFGKVRLAEFAIKNGIDADVAARDGSTPLLYASTSNHVGINRTLVSAGANVNFQNKDGKFPLFYAADMGSLGVAKFLIESGAKINMVDAQKTTALFQAALNGHHNVVELLIESGANPNLANHKGGTPLLQAVIKNSPDIVRFLLKSGAKPNATTSNEISPLMMAASSGSTQIVKDLLEHGAKPDLIGKSNLTALTSAVAKNRTSVVDLLLKAEADPNIKGFKGGTALYLAATNGNAAMVRRLLEAGANPELRADSVVAEPSIDPSFKEMLTESAYKELLAEEKARLNKNARGLSPIESAAKNGHLETVKVLRDNGADTSSLSEDPSLFKSVLPIIGLKGITKSEFLALDFPFLPMNSGEIGIVGFENSGQKVTYKIGKVISRGQFGHSGGSSGHSLAQETGPDGKRIYRFEVYSYPRSGFAMSAFESSYKSAMSKSRALMTVPDGCEVIYSITFDGENSISE